MSQFPKLNKKLKLMEERNDKPVKKPRAKKKINLEIDTDKVDIKIERPEGGKAEFKIDTDIIDIEKTDEGTKVKLEKGGLASLLFKFIGLGK